MRTPRKSVKGLGKDNMTNKKIPIRHPDKEREMRFDSKLIQCISEFTEINLSQMLGIGKTL